MMMIDSIYVSLRPGIMHMPLELSLDLNLSLLKVMGTIASQLKALFEKKDVNFEIKQNMD